ncbi:MAG: hypothetical protein AB8B95_02800 [Pseudohongiellaceae bacterium]
MIHYARLLLIFATVVLNGCSNLVSTPTSSTETLSRQRVKDPQIRVISEAEIIAGSRNRALSTPDLLYEALQDLDADRLLTPVDDSAHGKFRRVLATNPTNQIALEGIQSIVHRYLALADESIRRGLFEEAELMLDRARFVDAGHQGIPNMEEALAAERQSGDLFFTLDAAEVAKQTEDVKDQLRDIAKQAQQANAFFLITAPTDALGRWMFGIMRASVTGYRLRGNIEIASRTSVRLRMPSEGDQ